MTRRRAAGGVLVVLVALAPLGASCGGDGEGDLGTFCVEVERLVGDDPFAALPDRATPNDMQRAYDLLRDRADAIADSAVGEAAPVAEQYADAVAALDDLLAGALYSGDEVDPVEYANRFDTYESTKTRLERAANVDCAGL